MKKIGVILNKPNNNTVKIYTKQLKFSKKYKIKYFKLKKIIAESNSFNLQAGDIVEIELTRPLSKNKCFIVKRKLTY